MLKRAGETDLGVLEEHENALNPHLVETLAVLLKGGNVLHIPTNAGWAATLVGSGTTVQLPSYNYTRSGGTANSSALLNAELYGFSATDALYYYYNFARKTYFTFVYVADGNNANIVRRVQIKGSNAIGAMATKGVGIRVDNLSLVGESYGTALGALDLATTLTSDYPVLITIIHYPDTPKIEWYVNGTLKGTQTTANTIPTAPETNQTYLVHSIASGNPGYDAISLLFHPRIWQGR